MDLEKIIKEAIKEVLSETRLEQELSGELGEFWVKDAEERIARAKEKFDTDANIDENGAVSWKSNGSYIMDDMAELMEKAGCEFSREETTKARDEQNSKSIEEYRRRMKNHKPDSEEMYEMRSTFGPGEEVVDIFTGQRYKT